MADVAKIRPKALVIQLDPETSEVVEAALRYDIEMPSGEVIPDREHWWHEVTDGMRADLHVLARVAIAEIADCRQLTHDPKPPKPKEEAEA